MVEINKTFLLAADLAGIGSMSLSSAITIMQMFGVNLALSPTVLLSTQSEGFGKTTKLSTAAFLQHSFSHWHQIGQEFSGALVAYYEDEQVGALLKQWLVTTKPSLVIYDPACADQGALYPNISVELLSQKKELLTLADVICPNLTEASLLTGIKSAASKSELYLKLLQALATSNPRADIVITGISLGEKRGCVWLDQGKLQYALTPTLASHFYGAGDVFSALLSGFLLKGLSFSKAIRVTTNLLYSTLVANLNSDRADSYGLDLSSLLADFILRKDDFDDVIN